MKPRPMSEIPQRFHAEIMAQLNPKKDEEIISRSVAAVDECRKRMKDYTPAQKEELRRKAMIRIYGGDPDAVPMSLTPHVLPYPPSANNYWRSIVINGRGRVVVSKQAKDFKKAVSAALAGISPLSGPVALTATFYRPRKRGDLDNLLKVTCDALKGIAYHDDEQIEQITAYRKEDKANPRVELSVAQL